MDRDLLRQSLTYHGHSLFSLLKCEQFENPDFKLIVANLTKTLHPRKEKSYENASVEQFIARKADLLFAPIWTSSSAANNYINEETEDLYAIMPPVEQFMDVPFDERRDLFYRDIERGDVVIGRVNSIRDFGLFITLVCLGGGLPRNIEDLEITALCPVRDVPSHGNHDNPLSYYQVGDLIRAGVKDMDRYHGKLTVSLYSSSLSPQLSNLKLGIISSDEMPVHYRHSVSTACSSHTFDSVLQHTLGFANPATVEFLLGKLEIGETEPPSLMRGLQSKNFLEADYGTSIRKRQSASWALKCVKIGVDHFKSGCHVEAMNEYNKALEIDDNNVEALVARGALYATKGSLTKAIDDFELALESCPTHRNARKYLCQTLVERGGQLEEEEKLVTAEHLYRKALTLDDTFQEADEALKKLQQHIQKSLKLKEEEAAKEKDQSKIVVTSAEKLRKILKEEKRMKRKKRKLTSSSSSSSSFSKSSDSLVSSADHRKVKNRKQKQRDSPGSRWKACRRSSTHQDKSYESKEEWYPPPANTSASFLNQKYEVSKFPEGQDRSVEYKSQAKDRRYHSLSSSSVEILDDGGGRFDEHCFQGVPVKAERSKAKVKKGGRKSCPSCMDDSVKPRDRKSSGIEKEVAKEYRREEEESNFQLEFCSGLEKIRPRKYSSSSAGSEYSHKSDRYVNTKDYSSQGCSNSRSNSDRYDSVGIGDKKQAYQIEEEVQNFRRSDRHESRLSKHRLHNDKESAEAKRNLPSNLLDIFSQIAEFEKEKCTNSKKV
ncbi:tetratricopeptide repeat protein 14 [Amia ocellicauda]|uniref:tetratricopeptide repeat protein 14 n=1 Tax=Amia ocellicauda TaxID=2972642 RepID=UPI0034638E9F